MDTHLYQTLASRTLNNKPGFQPTDTDLMLCWTAIGLAGECGEVCDYIKKAIFHQHGFNKHKLADELGDVLWYVAALAQTAGLSLSDIMEQNIAKLKIRYPDGYSSERSINRET